MVGRSASGTEGDAGGDSAEAVRGTGHDGELGEEGVLAGVEATGPLVRHVGAVAVAEVVLVAEGGTRRLQRIHEPDVQ
jgi:hypothetical protein